MEIYALCENEAKELVSRFGGRVRPQPPTEALIRQTSRRKPLRIRGRLTVVDSVDSVPKKGVGKFLVIPAGVAFGTGDHATTASCLRSLADEAGRRRDRWSMLDLGSGSGILALAARRLGAERAEGCDFDADAVRVAKENAATNGLTEVRFTRRDVTRWQPARKWDVVTANLFHGVLVEAAEVIAGAVDRQGALIVSGILRDQEKATIHAFRPPLALEKTVRKGKWVTLLFRRG